MELAATRNTMMDRVADAIYTEFENRPLYAQAQMNGVLAMELAVAAIKAMREPTQAMCDAGFPVPPDDLGRFDNYPEQHRLAMGPKWRAMIDAALNPPKAAKSEITND